MASPQDCPMCDAIAEAERGEITIAMAMIRSFALGTDPWSNDGPRPTPEVLALFCLRHCHALQEHRAWIERNAGKPVPWPEDEPTA